MEDRQRRCQYRRYLSQTYNIIIKLGLFIRSQHLLRETFVTYRAVATGTGDQQQVEKTGNSDESGRVPFHGFKRKVMAFFISGKCYRSCSIMSGFAMNDAEIA